jgi:hypothetical protein
MVRQKKTEKIYVVGYYPVRRHARVLYIPLDPTVVRLHDLQKGDTIKAVILEVIRAPRPDDEIK